MPATGLYVKPLKATLQGAEAEWREYGNGEGDIENGSTAR